MPDATQNPTPTKRARTRCLLLMLVVIAIVFAVALLQVPAVKERVSFIGRSLYTRIVHLVRPPGQTTFNPVQQGTLNAAVNQTMQAWEAGLTQSAPTLPPPAVSTDHPAPTAQPSPEPPPTPTPQPTFAPLPQVFTLGDLPIQYQSFNNCGPANLAMLLNYWGWEGDQKTTQAVLREAREDRNVMLSEMADYVHANSSLRALVRYGGTLETAKRLVAAGFPILLERGHTDPKDGWMGHYSILTTYDDQTQKVRVPDTLLGYINLTYAVLEADWTHFAGVYLVVYPPEREAEVLQLLGEDAEPTQNLLRALQQYQQRAAASAGQQAFFDQYAIGTLQTELGDYLAAAASFDQAYILYNTLEVRQRPWRMLWYQVGPYVAYYQTGRYQDLVTLANITLNDTTEDSLPETWLWGARAYAAMGDTDNAIHFYEQALFWYPEWPVARQELAALQAQP